MKNILKKIKLAHALIFIILLLIISTGYFAYNNFKLNKAKVVDFSNSKNCNPINLEEAYYNISKYGTTTNKVNCGYGNPNIGIQPDSLTGIAFTNDSYAIPSAINLYPFPGNLSTRTIGNMEEENKLTEERNRLAGMRDSIIGCYYMTDNINERVKLDRNNSFSKFVEGMNRFAQINGSYNIPSTDFKSIEFVPFEESRFVMKLEIGTSSINLIDEKINKVFKKETCADFYPAY